MLKIDKAVEMIKKDSEINTMCVNEIGKVLFTKQDIVDDMCPSDFKMCDYDEEKCDVDVMCNHCWHEEVVDYDKCKYGYELGNVKKCDVVSIAIDNNEEDISQYIVDGNNCLSKCNCARHKEIEEANEKESNSCNKFEMIIKEMSELYEIKNANYGNSFYEQFKEYGMTSVCIRLDDKLRRLKTLNSKGSNGTNDESLRDTLIDLANYSVMAIMELDNKGE